MSENNRPRDGRLLTGFALLFVAVGSVLGTAAVLGPMSWLGMDAIVGSSQILGGAVVGAMLLLYLAVTLLMTRVLMRRILHGRWPESMTIGA